MSPRVRIYNHRVVTQDDSVPSVTRAQFGRLTREGFWEAMGDISRTGLVEVRVAKSGKRMMVRVEGRVEGEARDASLVSVTRAQFDRLIREGRWKVVGVGQGGIEVQVTRGGKRMVVKIYDDNEVSQYPV